MPNPSKPKVQKQVNKKTEKKKGGLVPFYHTNYYTPFQYTSLQHMNPRYMPPQYTYQYNTLPQYTPQYMPQYTPQYMPQYTPQYSVKKISKSQGHNPNVVSNRTDKNKQATDKEIDDMLSKAGFKYSSGGSSPTKKVKSVKKTIKTKK